MTGIRDADYGEVNLYGSSATGLDLMYSSDLDLTLDYYGSKRYQNVLREVRKQLENANRNRAMKYTFENISQHTASFGPTMEFKIVSKKNPSVYFEADILINKILEVYNTELLSTYVKLDSHFRDLCLIMKYLNKEYFPNKSARMNSYSIVLMCLAYLQHEGILPKLQVGDGLKP